MIFSPLLLLLRFFKSSSSFKWTFYFVRWFVAVAFFFPFFASILFAKCLLFLILVDVVVACLAYARFIVSMYALYACLYFIFLKMLWVLHCFLFSSLLKRLFVETFTFTPLMRLFNICLSLSLSILSISFWPLRYLFTTLPMRSAHNLFFYCCGPSVCFIVAILFFVLCSYCPQLMFSLYACLTFSGSERKEMENKIAHSIDHFC